MQLRLDPEDLQAWLRTLAAIRLVLATRLGIKTEDDHDEDDPRFGIYDWLGYRLDGLVRAAEARTDLTSGDREDVRRVTLGIVACDVALLLLGPLLPVRPIRLAVARERAALARVGRRFEPHPHVPEPRRRRSEQARALRR